MNKFSTIGFRHVLDRFSFNDDVADLQKLALLNYICGWLAIMCTHTYYKLLYTYLIILLEVLVYAASRGKCVRCKIMIVNSFYLAGVFAVCTLGVGAKGLIVFRKVVERLWQVKTKIM